MHHTLSSISSAEQAWTFVLDRHSPADEDYKPSQRYTAMSHNALADTRSPAEKFYVDSGASDHLIPSRDNLYAYQKFVKPVEVSAANGVKISAYGSGTLRVATSPTA